jgi:hypothetical protein
VLTHRLRHQASQVLLLLLLLRLLLRWVHVGCWWCWRRLLLLLLLLYCCWHMGSHKASCRLHSLHRASQVQLRLRHTVAASLSQPGISATCCCCCSCCLTHCRRQCCSCC